MQREGLVIYIQYKQINIVSRVGAGNKIYLPVDTVTISCIRKTVKQSECFKLLGMIIWSEN